MRYDEYKKIDNLVAEKIMGWSISRSGRKEFPGFIADKDNKTLMSTEQWKPSSNIFQAWTVVQEMIWHGYYWHFSMEDGCSYAAIGKREEVSLDHRKDKYLAEADDIDKDAMPLVICLAALDAIEVAGS